MGSLFGEKCLFCSGPRDRSAFFYYLGRQTAVFEKSCTINNKHGRLKGWQVMLLVLLTNIVVNGLTAGGTACPTLVSCHFVGRCIT